MSVLQVWAEGVDEEGVKEVDEEEEGGVMGEGPARTTGDDVGSRTRRGLSFLSLSGLSSSTCCCCWWWPSPPPRSRHLVTLTTAPASSFSVAAMQRGQCPARECSCWCSFYCRSSQAGSQCCRKGRGLGAAMMPRQAGCCLTCLPCSWEQGCYG